MKLRLAEQKSRNAGLDGLAALQSEKKDDGDVAARKKEIAELKERVEELQVRLLTCLLACLLAYLLTYYRITPRDDKTNSRFLSPLSGHLPISSI